MNVCRMPAWLVRPAIIVIIACAVSACGKTDIPPDSQVPPDSAPMGGGPETEAGEQLAGDVANDASANEAPAQDSADGSAHPFSQPVILKTSEPAIAINRVMWLGADKRVNGLGTNTVQWQEGGDEEGVECRLYDYVFTLSNGSIVSPMPNICEDAPAAIPVAPLAMTEPEPQVLPDMVWMFKHFEPEAKGLGQRQVLIFGIPETDALAFAASCHSGAGFVEIAFYLETDGADATLPVRVDAHIDEVAYLFESGWTSPQSEEEGSAPLVRIATSHPMLAGMQTGEHLDVSINGASTFRLPLMTGHTEISAFNGACVGGDQPAGVNRNR